MREIVQGDLQNVSTGDTGRSTKPAKSKGNYHFALESLIKNAPTRLGVDGPQNETVDSLDAFDDEVTEVLEHAQAPWKLPLVIAALASAVLAGLELRRRFAVSTETGNADARPPSPQSDYEDFQSELKQGGYL